MSFERVRSSIAATRKRGMSVLQVSPYSAPLARDRLEETVLLQLCKKCRVDKIFRFEILRLWVFLGELRQNSLHCLVGQFRRAFDKRGGKIVGRFERLAL